MKFFIYAQDKPDHFDLRKATRAKHIEYLANFEDQYVAAGPCTTDDGTLVTGSALIMEFTDRAAAEEFAANDPYAKAGLFATTEIRVWVQVYPKVD